MAPKRSVGTEPKAELRARIRAVRRQRESADRERASQSITASVLRLLAERDDSCVACYLSGDFEPSTAALMQALWSLKKEVITPRVRGDALEWVVTTPDSGQTIGAFGIREVDEGAARSLDEADVILVPALAIDEQGYRLGQGGGFYDRALANLAPAPLLIGLVFAAEDVTVVPRERHDLPVDAVVTEAGVRWVTTGGSSGSR